MLFATRFSSLLERACKQIWKTMVQAQRIWIQSQSALVPIQAKPMWAQIQIQTQLSWAQIWSRPGQAKFGSEGLRDNRLGLHPIRSHWASSAILNWDTSHYLACLTNQVGINENTLFGILNLSFFFSIWQHEFRSILIGLSLQKAVRTMVDIVSFIYLMVTWLKPATLQLQQLAPAKQLDLLIYIINFQLHSNFKQ